MDTLPLGVNNSLLSSMQEMPPPLLLRDFPLLVTLQILWLLFLGRRAKRASGLLTTEEMSSSNAPLLLSFNRLYFIRALEQIKACLPGKACGWAECVLAAFLRLFLVTCCAL